MSDEKKLSERIKWKAFRLHPADRDSVVVSKATLDRWINEIAALEQRLAEANDYIRYTADKGTRFLGKHEEAVSFAMQENIHD